MSKLVNNTKKIILVNNTKEYLVAVHCWNVLNKISISSNLFAFLLPETNWITSDDDLTLIWVGFLGVRFEVGE